MSNEELTRAELLLKQLPTGQRLINRLKVCMDEDMAPRKATLSNSNRAKIQAFRNEIQEYIDQLAAQREQVISLIEQIPDQEQQLLLNLHYGVIGNAQRATPWEEVAEYFGFWNMEPIYRRRKAAINALNKILEKKDGETDA